MKIGLFTDTYYPQINGVATSVLMLKENLERLGHEVYVFTTTDPSAQSDDIHVYRVPSLPFKSSKRLGMFYHPHLARIISGLGLDIIHTHTEFSLGIFGRSMARVLNIPLIHTYHTIYEDYTHYIVNLGVLDSIAKTAARKMSTKFCNSVDEVIVPTKKVKDLLLSYLVRKDIVVIPTGIELDKYSKNNYDAKTIENLRTSLGINAKDKVILYLGRLSEEKNIKEVLKSMQSYLKERKEAKFLLIGDGPERDNLQMMAKELRINNQTIFAGEKPWKEIGMYYQLGDVFVSASSSETQGLTYIEALASGIPVIAKADPCLEGVLQDGINGYAFYGKDDFLHHLDSVLFNQHLKNQLSLGAIKSVQKFSGKQFAFCVETEYVKIHHAWKEYEGLLKDKIG